MHKIHKIDLIKMKPEFITLSYSWFHTIMGLKARHDSKERTGIQVLVHEPSTRNLILFSIGETSDFAKFLVSEKAVRANIVGHVTSQESEDHERLRFPGSVSVRLHGITLQVSASGMKSEEDVAISIGNLALAFRVPPAKICEELLKHGGRLPSQLSNPKHYLYDFVNSKVVPIV